MNTSRIPTPVNWTAFAMAASNVSKTSYNALCNFKRYCQDRSILPTDVIDEHLEAARLHWRAAGHPNPDTLYRSTCKHWNELGHEVSLPPLAPVPTRRSSAANAWAALPASFRAATSRFVGPCGPTDPPTRERTNLLAAALTVTAKGLPVDLPADFMTAEAIDAIVDGVDTIPKLRSQLETLAGLATHLGLGVEHDRARAAIRDHARPVKGVDPGDAGRVAQVAAESRDNILLHFEANILVLNRLEAGGCIRIGDRVLTRKNLLPRAQDAMAAVMILRDGTMLTDLCRCVFIERDGCQRLVRLPKSTEHKGDAVELKLSGASLELLQLTYGTIQRHIGRPPKSLFETINPDRRCGPKRRADSVGKGIAVLLSEINVVLAAVELRQLWLDNLIGVARDDAEADYEAKRDPNVREVAHAAGKRFSNALTMHHGSGLDAEVAQQIADDELGADGLEDDDEPTVATGAIDPGLTPASIADGESTHG